MQTLSCIDDIKNIKDNDILFGTNVSFTNSHIEFRGHNNIVYIDNDCKIVNSTLRFQGDQSVIYICKTGHNIHLNMSLHHDSVLYIGYNNYFNGILTGICSEQKHLIIGNNCLFSTGIMMRNADPHLIYDIESHQRINMSKSIVIGDHVWIGQNAFILKGSFIGSGSIIGGYTVVTSKKYPSNVIIAGNPGKIVKQGIFWAGNSVHYYKSDATTQNMFKDDPSSIFHVTPATLNHEHLLNSLDTANSQNKLILLKELAANKEKNRFSCEHTLEIS